jgi:hypothetical protein
MKTLRKGQAVTVSSAIAGTCAGRVLEVRTPEDLEPVPEAPNVALVAACMRDLDVQEVAYIAHLHAGRLVCFAALRDGAGNWRDLHHQPLTITPIHGFWEVKDPPEEPAEAAEAAAKGASN